MNSSFAVESECDFQVTHDAVTLDTKQLSDHTMLKLRLQTREHAPGTDQKMPALIFKSHEYQNILKRCLEGCSFEF